MDVAEIKKLDTYLKRLFSSPRIRVVPRPQRDDYAEVFLGDEPFGRITVDDEDEERSYNFEKAITMSGSGRSPKLDAETVTKLNVSLKTQLGEKFSVRRRPTAPARPKSVRRRRFTSRRFKSGSYQTAYRCGLWNCMRWRSRRSTSLC